MSVLNFKKLNTREKFEAQEKRMINIGFKWMSENYCDFAVRPSCGGLSMLGIFQRTE